MDWKLEFKAALFHLHNCIGGKVWTPRAPGDSLSPLAMTQSVSELYDSLDLKASQICHEARLEFATLFVVDI
jgi:hypothetical protein